MPSEITITLTSKREYGPRLPSGSFGAFLERLAPVARQSVQMAFQHRSTSRGRSPLWLDRASDVRFVGHQAEDSGDTSLLFEAPILGEAAYEHYIQQELWPDRPDPDDTALDLLGDVVAAIGTGDRDSRWLDAPLLRNIGGFARCLDGGFDAAFIRSRRHAEHPVKLDAGVAQTARSMRASAPSPQRIRIVGKLDMVRLSTQTFGLKLTDGNEVDGVLAAGEFGELVPLLSSEVLVRGSIVYRPSGRPLRIDADSVEAAARDESPLWSALPSPEAGRGLAGLRRPQAPKTGVGAIIGQWPGEETDEEIAEALERLS